MNKSKSFALFFVALFSFSVLAFPPMVVGQSFTKTGKVVEAIDAKNYTYLHLDMGAEKLWVAVPSTEVKQGETVSFADGLIMKDFHSKTLNKTFETIIFSPGLEGDKKTSFHGQKPAQKKSSSFADAVKKENTSTAPQPAQPTVQNSSGSAGAIVPMTEQTIEKAKGNNSFTVEEVFNKGAELHSQKVQIRGKVVKFSPNIMGKNWIHLQDGTGNPMQNSHDLVVTTAEQAKVDDIITIEGTLASKKDFGYGYKYEVIVEDATILK